MLALVAGLCGGIPRALLGWVGLHRSAIYVLIFGRPPPSDAIARVAIDLPAAYGPQVLQGLAVGWMCGLLLSDMQGDAEADRHNRSWTKRIVPLSLLALLSAAAFTVGLFLLVAPGVIFAIASTVAVPAMVSEGLGPVASIRRSFDLTRGAQGAIFGVAVVNGLAAIAFDMLGTLTATGSLIAPGAPVVAYLVTPLGGSLELIATAAFISSAYLDLVSRKGGPAPAVAETFA